MTNSIGIVLADGSLLDALSRAIRARGNSVVVYGNGSAFLENYSLGELDAVLIDQRNSYSSEYELLARIHSIDPCLQIIVINRPWNTMSITQSLRLGAFDVLEMPFPMDQLYNTVAAAVDFTNRKRAEMQTRLPPNLAEKLNYEEAEILQHLLAGLTVKEVAAKLDTSIRTVHYRKKAIFEKLGVSDRNSAIAILQKPKVPAMTA